MGNVLLSSTNRVDVPALRKAIAVFELLARTSDLTMTEIQERTGNSKTMTFRILRVLTELGYVGYDPPSRRYSLGLPFLKLGAAVAERLDVASISQPLITELRDEFGETVNVGVLAEKHIVYVAMAESHQGLRMAARLGTRDPLHSTSIGKAILAFLTPDQRAAAMATDSLRRITPYTITDHSDLVHELDQIRERGYAVDNEENELGARCVGVPILSDGVSRAGLSVSGPRSRLADERIPVIAARLWQASRLISLALGDTSSDGAKDAAPFPVNTEQTAPDRAPDSPILT